MPDWFGRRSSANTRTNGATLPKTEPAEVKQQAVGTPVNPFAHAIPEGAFTKCTKCGTLLYTKDFERDFKVCAKCGYHHRLTAAERINYTVDEGTFSEFDADLTPVDPLNFPDYKAKITKSEQTSGRNDALVIGTAKINGKECVLAVADFAFMGGSMGSVFGEKFVRAADKAQEEQKPFVVFCASGGARMQEGLFGLMQMAKTSMAVAQLAEEKVPYLVVLTDPTTGGAFASFASLGDVIYAEPGAYVAFAGTRVAQQAQTQKPPANYQTAEFQEEHGMLDRIVPRKEMANTLYRTLAFFGG